MSTPRPNARRLAFGVFFLVGGIAAFFWFVRGPWDTLAENRLLVFFAWFASGVATVLSLLGVSLRDLRPPNERPELVPDLFAMDRGAEVDLEFMVSNVGTAVGSDVELQLTTFSSPGAVVSKFNGRGLLPHGGNHWHEWKVGTFAKAELDGICPFQLRADCTDDTGKKIRGRPYNFSKEDILAKALK